MEHINAFKAAIAAVCAALTTLWGWFGWVVFAWIVSMIIDYLTGSAAALRAGEWSSKAARDGIWHKVGSIVAVIVAALLDVVIGHLLANVPAWSCRLPTRCCSVPWWSSGTSSRKRVASSKMPAP